MSSSQSMHKKKDKKEKKRQEKPGKARKLEISSWPE
jgi:hypothetical protein